MTQPEDTDLALDPELMAYIDGQLPPEKMAAIEARLAHDPEACAAVAQLRHFDNLLYSHGRSADDMPRNLKIAALERELATRLRKAKWRGMFLRDGLRRVAAGVVLFVAGWSAHGLYTSASETLRFADNPYFIAPTLAGHAAYTLASYQQVQFSGEDIESALDWISERMQQKVDSPKLERLGYEVESARLIMDAERPVAVFFFRNPEGERVTVSMAPKWTMQRDYDLRVVDVADGVMAYWSSQDLHYTIVANDNRGAITTLAAAVQQ